MRATFAVLALLIAVSEGMAQFRPGGAPGGAPPGGFPGGGKGGFSMAGGPKDPNQVFEFLAKGRPYILISEMRSLRDPLTQYAKDNGITNDQVTRQQFTTFYAKMDQYRATSSSPRSPFGEAPGGPPTSPGGPPTGGVPGAGPNPLEAISQWAETDFRRRDQNGDSRLNADEMPDSLKSQLERWDTDRDGLMNLDEYKVYYSARLQMRDGPANAQPNPITILIEEDYDRRPDVIRAGKLPKELPKWFAELDTDQDGQVALFEWNKGGKDIEEFHGWDRNDDGLMTAEEVMFKQKAGLSTTATATNRGPSSSGERPSFGGGERPSFGGGGERPSFNRGSDSGSERRPGGFGGGASGPGGFFGKKKG